MTGKLRAVAIAVLLFGIPAYIIHQVSLVLGILLVIWTLVIQLILWAVTTTNHRLRESNRRLAHQLMEQRK